MSTKGQKDAGIWFVRLPRSQTVSIVSYFRSFQVKKSLFKSCRKVNSLGKNAARLQILFCYQVWENSTFKTSIEIVKFHFNRHYLRNQQKVNKTSKFKSLKISEIILDCCTIKMGRSLRRGEEILLLRGGDIESNPGPGRVSESDKKITLITYNVRGLKEYTKLKRVLNSCAELIKTNRNTIICLQETHLERNDENKLRVMWREGFVSSPGGNKSRGCITLYDNSWDKIESQADPSGRYTVLTLKKPFGIYTIVNLYAPNKHNINFFEKIILELVKSKDTHSSVPSIVGDFNLVIDPAVDSLNRDRTNSEKAVGTFVKDSLEALGLRDAFRHKNKDKGYTWSRGNCYSRLDMIFIDKEMLKNLSLAETKWAFDRSDHALVKI